MSNLFIIGNGFDIAHDLPTSYEDFHQYLIRKYPNAPNMRQSFNIKKIKMPDGTKEFNKDEVVAFLIDRISSMEKNGNNWCDIETSLGRLDYENYINELAYLSDKEIKALIRDEFEDGDFFMRGDGYDMLEHISNNLLEATIIIQELFSEWVNTIDISSTFPMNSFANLLNPSKDTFLTFNYTTVLEEIYGAEDVQHLHGIQNGEIIFGHGEEEKDGFSTFTFTTPPLLLLHSILKKDTESILSDHLYPFLDNLVENFFENSFEDDVFIEKIYTYGFSFSKVDLPYIKGICLSIDTSNVTWYLHTFHNDEERKRFKGIIEECGFKGRFDTFS
ncbi:bacteriophage abortive infection AbiH family protein [Peribacillus frigoritolerans]|uniref:bacteriophage abortive infection AbiH family protein n=1 Tax=Peribacillus frigoritolerans TaxID=450367 RepID=UPI0020BE149D|nr:bacteriophage abortive infection AbiH family protein [Peribacillus frigoritolerans]